MTLIDGAFATLIASLILAAVVGIWKLYGKVSRLDERLERYIPATEKRLDKIERTLWPTDRVSAR